MGKKSESIILNTLKLNVSPRFKLFRVTPKTQLDLDFLHALEVMAPFDFWSKLPIEPKGTVDIMVAPPTLAYFTQHLDYHKMPYKILIEDVEKIISKDRQKALSDTLESREISFTRYNRYDEVFSLLCALFKYLWKFLLI